jgi:hypothetical protein
MWTSLNVLLEGHIRQTGCIWKLVKYDIKSSNKLLLIRCSGEVYSIQHYVIKLLATGWWFSPGTPISSTIYTDHHDITEILLKVALNTIKPNLISNSLLELLMSYFTNFQIQPVCLMWLCSVLYVFDLSHTSRKSPFRQGVLNF